MADGGKGGHVQSPANPPVALLADPRESVDGGAGLKEDDVQTGIAGQLLRPDLAESGSVFADEGQSGFFSDARNREQQTRALRQLGVLVEVHSGLGSAKLEGLLQVLEVSFQGAKHKLGSVGIGLSFFHLIPNLIPLLSEL